MNFSTWKKHWLLSYVIKIIFALHLWIPAESKSVILNDSLVGLYSHQITLWIIAYDTIRHKDPNFQGQCQIVHLSWANSQNRFSSRNVTFSKFFFWVQWPNYMDIKQYPVLRIWSSHFKFGDSDIGDLKLARIFGCFDFCRR